MKSVKLLHLYKMNRLGTKVTKRKNPYTKTKPVKRTINNKMSESEEALALNTDTESELLNSDSENSEPKSVASSIVPVHNLDISLARDEMMVLLKEIRDSQCTRNDFQRYSQTIKKQFDDVHQEIETNTAAIGSMDSRIITIEKALERNKYEAELSKQNVISRNLSVMGVPPVINEDLISIALKLFSLVGCELKRTDIFGCYRIKKGKAFTNIFIVKINDFTVKHNILKAKVTKEIKLKDVINANAESSNQSVYINNHVIPFFGKLLAEGRRRIKDKNVHSVWLGKNGCQLRFDAAGPEHSYRSLEELNRLVDEHQNQQPQQQSNRKTKRMRSNDDDISPKNMQKNKK